MNGRAVEKPARASWTDERLVRECLAGSEEAWAALLEQYKNLIYSIPIKVGLGPDAAADIFQSVCVDLLDDLAGLRQPRALAGWLIRVTLRKSLRWEREQRRFRPVETELDRAEAPSESVPGVMLAELEREQALRDSIRELSPRCRELMRALFFVHPPVPYQEIARDLGLATGSIGFIRGRCLETLRRRLEKRGFP